MQLTVVHPAKGTAQTEAVAIGVFENDKGLVVSSPLLSGAERKDITQKLLAKEFKGGKAENLTLRSCVSGAAEAVWVAGLGKREKFTPEIARKLGASLLKKAKAEKWVSVRVDAEAIYATAGRDGIQALAEGILLADYRFDRYFSKKKNSNPAVKSVEIAVVDKASAASAQEALRVAQIIAEGVTLARDFANEPPNVIYPQAYAERIQKAAVAAGVRCEIFDEKKLAALKMGGILGVGKGSERKPRLVILEYKPAKASGAGQPVVLVGKGVTFDTGGISLKPGKSMDEMKFDMSGSAAVAATLITAAKLKLPVHLIGLTPLAENMPDGAAQRPGDILTCYNGKTVEVLNTDAEGRLILADALAYAEKFKPRYLVDIATLTGACAATLDYVGSGVMSNDPELVARLKTAGDKTGERLWEFPLWEEYNEFIKGTYADIQNISRRTAGIQTAGMFLQNFGGHAKWAHLDVAGTAWTQGARDYNTVGATGVGVRLFIEFLRTC